MTKPYTQPALLVLLLSSVLPIKSAVAADNGDTSFAIGEHLTVTGKPLADAATLLGSVDRLGSDVAQSSDSDYPWQLVGQMPGVMLTDFNQGTTSGKLSFRGFNGEGDINAVKLLIDGIPSNSNDGNMPYLDMIFPLDLEGIEVVRSTSDPRYGLYNIAGNVTLLTRSGGNYLDGKLSAGSFGRRQGQVALGHEAGRLSQNYSAGYLSSDGYRDHSSLSRKGVSGKWALAVTHTLTLGASARHYEARADEAGYLTGPVAARTPRASNSYNQYDGDSRTMNQFSLNLDWALPKGQLNALSWLNQLSDDRYVTFSEGSSQQRRYTHETHYGVRATYNVDPQLAAFHRLHLALGISTEQQDNTSERYLTVARVPTSQTRDWRYHLNVSGLYGQLMMEPVRWLRITPAWRLDRVSGSLSNRLTDSRADANDYGTISQPKLSLALLPLDNLTFFGNWGRTFQIGVGAGSYRTSPSQPDLAPSINQGWELGIKYQPTPDSSVRLSRWNQTASGELEVKLNDPNGDYANLGKTKRDGIDLQGTWTPSEALTLWASVAWQEAVIVTPDPATPELAGNDIDHVPHRLISGGGDYQLTPKLSLSASLRAQTRYYLTTRNSEGHYGAFTLLDLKARYTLNSHWELGAAITNLTNAHHEYLWWDNSQSLHSPGDERAFTLSVRASY
ncbi:TonB-dependent receptor [Gallaecimonas pentaromativorans]|uniref:TonB-dependent receptor n=1 Tax=Gallaecimonas pentaromativorans TaxID=584787 RepID=UPI0009FAA6CD|nr:TonB-dependent receptor [Gallaecimonas pentaromativorans]